MNPGFSIIVSTYNRADLLRSALESIQALRLPLPGEPGVYLYLEYRQAREDSRWAGVGAAGNKQDAVLAVRSTDAGRDTSRTQLLQLGGPLLSGISPGVHYALGRELSF